MILDILFEDIDPDNSRVHLKRGESYFLLHRYAESLPDFRAALPSHSSALTYLIKAYHLLGKAEEGDSFLSGCNTASCKRLKTVSDQMKKDLLYLSSIKKNVTRESVIELKLCSCEIKDGLGCRS